MSDPAKPQEGPPQHDLVELHGTRAGWPEGMTADEQRILGEHFAYLKDLRARGIVLLAGPVFGRFGPDGAAKEG